MLSNATVFVEITGVFGAGYVPRLLEEVQQRLTSALRRQTTGGARKLCVLRCVDNSLAEKANLEYRNTVDGLIGRAATLSTSERDALVRGLHWVDRLVFQFVRGVRK